MLLFLATNMAAVTPLVATSQQEYVHDHVYVVRDGGEELRFIWLM